MILDSFGSKIKELRLKTGLSQEQFALKIFMDRAYYSSVENGKRNVSLISIEKIARGLGVPISQIFTEIEKDNDDKGALRSIDSDY